MGSMEKAIINHMYGGRGFADDRKARWARRGEYPDDPLLRDVQVQIDLIALWHGLRPGNLTVEWDGGTTEMITGTHDLVISAAHGAHSVTLTPDHDALMRHDQPDYLPRFKSAIAKLKELAADRGPGAAS